MGEREEEIEKEIERRRVNDETNLKIFNEIYEIHTTLKNFGKMWESHERILRGESGTNGVCGTLKTICAKVESTQTELTEHKVDDDKAHTRISEEMKWILGIGVGIMTVIVTVIELKIRGVL